MFLCFFFYKGKSHVRSSLLFGRFLFYGAAFHPAMFSDNEVDHATLRAKSQKAVVALFQFADAEYAQRDWIADDFSVADLYLYATFRWATLMDFELSSVPNLKALALHGKEPL